MKIIKIKAFLEIIKSPEKSYRFFGSRSFSVFTMTLLLFMLIVWLLPFQIYGVPPQVTQNIAKKQWLFRIPYILFFVNAFLCFIQSFKPNINRIIRRKELINRERLERMPHFYERGDGYLSINLGNLKSYLRLKGYSVIKQSNGNIDAYRGNFSPLGNILLHASFFLIPLGLLVSSFTSFGGEAIITEGQTFSAKDISQYSSIFTEKGNKTTDFIPDISFRLDKVQPVFWQDKLLFTDLSADLAYSNDYSQYQTIRLNSPLFYKGTFISIRGFGYSPYYIIKDKEGKVINESFVALRIFPSGAEDSFSVNGFPYNIKVTLWSDYVKKNGKYESKTYNLANPIYRIRLADNKGKVVQEKYLLPGDEMSYNGYSISFSELRYYGQFSIARDYGIWFIIVGFLMASLGLIIKMIFYRKEFHLFNENDAIIVAGRAEYFNKLYQREFQKIVKFMHKG